MRTAKGFFFRLFEFKLKILYGTLFGVSTHHQLGTYMACVLLSAAKLVRFTENLSLTFETLFVHREIHAGPTSRFDCGAWQTRVYHKERDNLLRVTFTYRRQDISTRSSSYLPQAAYFHSAVAQVNRLARALEDWKRQAFSVKISEITASLISPQFDQLARHSNQKKCLKSPLLSGRGPWTMELGHQTSPKKRSVEDPTPNHHDRFNCSSSAYRRRMAAFRSRKTVSTK